MATREMMQQAHQLIKQKRYSEARRILSKIEHPKAKEWLARLDSIAPEMDESGLPAYLSGADAELEQSTNEYSIETAFEAKRKRQKKQREKQAEIWSSAQRDDRRSETMIFAMGSAGALIGAVLGAGAWTIGLYYSGLMFMPLVPVFGGALIGGITGISALLLARRETFYNGLSAAVMTLVGYLLSSYSITYLLMRQELGWQESPLIGSTISTVIQQLQTNPLLAFDVFDGIALVVGAAIAFRIASSMGGLVK